MAGMGLKPMTRSEPWRLTVWMVEAATSSSTSLQELRRRPPMPRASW